MRRRFSPYLGGWRLDVTRHQTDKKPRSLLPLLPVARPRRLRLPLVVLTESFSEWSLILFGFMSATRSGGPLQASQFDTWLIVKSAASV